MNSQKRAFIEVIVIMTLLLIATFFVKELKGLMSLVAISYFLVERRVRKCSEEDTGLNFKNIPKNIAKNWHFILLVSVVFQIIFFLILKNIPGALEHIKARLPIDKVLCVKLANMRVDYIIKISGSSLASELKRIGNTILVHRRV